MDASSKDMGVSKENFLYMIENLDVGFYKGDLDGKILMHNRALNEILGFDPSKDLTGKLAEHFFKNKADQKKFYSKLMEMGKVKNYIVQVKKQDGKIITVQINAHVVKEFDDKLTTIEGTVIDISENYQLEQKLKESEEKHRVFMETAQDFMHIIDNKGKIIYTNRDFLGYKKEELMNMHISELIAEETLPKFAQNLKDLIKNGRITLTDLYCKGKDGTKIIGELNVVAIYGTDGKFNGARGIFNDITERKKIEQELKESEEVLRVILNSTADGILVVNNSSQVIHTNTKFADMWRIPKYLVEKGDDKKLLDYVLSQLKDPESFISKVEQLYRSSSIDYDTLYFKDDRIFERFSGPLIREGEINGRVWNFRDVTESKKAERKLRESEESYRLITENVNDLIAVFDTNLKYKFVNKAYELLGYSIEEIYETRPTDYLHPDDVKRALRAFRKVLKTGMQSEELRIKNTKGIFSWFEVKGKTFTNLNGELNALLISRDITERKRVEQKLRDSEEQYRNLINNIQDVIAEIDSEGKLNYSSPQITSLLGYQLEEIIGKEYISYVHPEDISIVINGLKKSRQSLLQSGIEFRMKHKKGHYVFVSARGNMINIDGEQKIIGILSDITEKVETEQKLKESEERYRTIINSLGDPIHVIDRNYKIILTNVALKNWVKSLNLNLEIVGKTPKEAWPFLPDWAMEEYHSIFNDGKPIVTTGSLIINNKEIITETRKIPIFKNEKVIQIITLLRDITKNKEAEQRLRESEEKYRLGFESSTDGIASADMEGKFLDFNKVFLDMLGYPKEELLKLSFREITPQRWHKMEDNMIISQLAEGKDSGIYEKEYIRKDGTILPINIRFWLIKDDQGDPVRMWKIVRDITERKKAEEEIRLQSEIIENMAEGVYLIKLNDGMIVFTNPAFEEMFGYDPGEMIGKNVVIVNAPTNRTPEETKEEIIRILKDKGDWHGDVLNIKKDGTLFWCFVNVSLFDHPEYGTVIIAVHTDITKRKKAEEEIMNLTKLKSEFLRRASHELKTPLISIKGFSDLILALHRDQINPDVISKLNEINSGCERLQNIINNLLATSRLESPDIRPKVQREDLTFLIKYCVHELKSLAQTRSQIINLEISDGQYALFEKEEIHDVISNLLTNAIKYTPPMVKLM